MRRKLSCLLVILIVGSLASCGNDSEKQVTENNAPPTWEKTIGGEAFERANCVVSVPGGGYVIAGTVGLQQSSDIYLVRITDDGEIVWEPSIGGSDFDEVSSIVSTADGGYLLTGSTSSMGYGGLDSYLLKVGASGNKSWDNAFGGTADDRGVFGSAITDGYLLAGTATGPDGVSTSVMLVHTFPAGSLRERDIRDASGVMDAYAGAKTADGGAIIVGTVALGGHQYPDVYLLQTDASGEVVWEYSFGGDVVIHPWAIVPVGGDFVIAGDVRDDPFGDSDAYLAKIDETGNLLWEQRFGSDRPDELHAVCPTSEGGVAVAGWTQEVLIRGSDVYLAKLRSDGLIEWEQTFGGESFDEGFGVATTPEGGYLVVGRTASFGMGGGDFYVIKTDSRGNVAPSM